MGQKWTKIDLCLNDKSEGARVHVRGNYMIVPFKGPRGVVYRLHRRSLLGDGWFYVGAREELVGAKRYALEERSKHEGHGKQN